MIKRQFSLCTPPHEFSCVLILHLEYLVRDRLIENFTKVTAFFINKTVVCEPTVLIARQCKACIVVISGVNFWTTLSYLGVKISFQISTGNSCSVKFKEKVSDGVFSYLNLVWRSETSLEKNIFREVFLRNF